MRRIEQRRFQSREDCHRVGLSDDAQADRCLQQVRHKGLQEGTQCLGQRDVMGARNGADGNAVRALGGQRGDALVWPRCRRLEESGPLQHRLAMALGAAGQCLGKFSNFADVPALAHASPAGGKEHPVVPAGTAFDQLRQPALQIVGAGDAAFMHGLLKPMAVAEAADGKHRRQPCHQAQQRSAAAQGWLWP